MWECCNIRYIKLETDVCGGSAASLTWNVTVRLGMVMRFDTFDFVISIW